MNNLQNTKRKVICFMQVTCTKNECYQAVTESFWNEHQNWKGFKLEIIEER